MPAVSTALSRQPPFTELALGTKPALTAIQDQKTPQTWWEVPAFARGGVSRAAED